MAISLLSTPMYLLLSAAICVIYPCYNTFVLLYSGVLNGKDGKADEGNGTNCGIMAHHIFYWAIFYVAVKLEHCILFFVIPYTPLFYELKLLAFFWLASEHFKGAGFLFHRFVMSHVVNTGNTVLKEIDEKLDLKNKKTLTDLSKHLGSINELQFASMDL